MATENAKKEVKDVQVNVGKDLSTAMLNGTKIEISPEGNVVVFTNEGVQTKPATTATPAAATKEKTLDGLAAEIAAIEAVATADKQITIGKDFNTVAMYGATVEVAPDGKLIVSTNGTVKVKPAAANDAAALANDTAIVKAKYALEVGDRMTDGTIYAGISPDTNQPMYASPGKGFGIFRRSNDPIGLDFNDAAQYAKDLEVGGKKGFRIPTKNELNVLFKNKDKGALKGTFNTTGFDPYHDYWSSSPDDRHAGYAHAQRFNGGRPLVFNKNNGLSVRCVR